MFGLPFSLLAAVALVPQVRSFSVADGVTLTRDGAVVYVHFHKPGVDTATFKAEGEFACGMQLRDGRLATLARTADGQLSVTARRPAGFAGELVVKLVPALANPFARKGIELAAPEAANVGRFCTFVKERLAKDGFDTLFLLTTWYASEQLMDALEGEGIRMESEKAFERLRGVVEVYRAFAAKGAK